MLQDLASGRKRRAPRHPGDIKEGLVAYAALILIGAAYGVWHEWHEGPRHERNVISGLREAGYPEAHLRREWLRHCGRGGKAYGWRSGSATGTACSYGDAPRASIQVVQAQR